MNPPVDIAVIGGSGLYSLLEDGEPVEVDTPFGPPSQAPVVGTVGGARVAFLARHGPGHRYLPHTVPYRANVWALRALGARRILAPCAVGSLRPEVGPGCLVLPDQLVDRTTSGRAQTYYDGPGAVHVGFADPYCPTLRAGTAAAAARADWPVLSGATMVVVEGPRFSTRAESQSYAAAGWTLVNMTGHPEAVLARELAVCYAAVALVTDLDAGIEGGPAVTQHEVFEVFAANTERLRAVLLDTVASTPDVPDCGCRHALDGLPHGLPPAVAP